MKPSPLILRGSVFLHGKDISSYVLFHKTLIQSGQGFFFNS